jgi:hypothetical protein
MLEPFHKLADVKEIWIETANRSQAEIAEDILKNFNIILPLYYLLFYGEFDGQRNKRVLVKVIGE